MNIIIAGGGLIAKGIINRLIANKHEVTVIDSNPAVCEEIYSKYGAVTINGNASDLEILESARIDKCHAALAVTRNDSDNLAFALLAKQHYKVPQVMVRMSDPKYEDVYKSIGVDNIARSTDLLIDQFMISLESPDLRKIISIGNLDICLVNVPENSKVAGKKINQLVKEKNFPANIIITCIMIENDEKYIIPKGDTQINSGDRLFLCGLLKDIKKASSIITKT